MAPEMLYQRRVPLMLFFLCCFLNGMSLFAARPNILFMMADDHTSQAWGCYGSRFSPHFKTPHIDRIAREGMRLKHCFVTNSICVPSRASILTGQYSHVNGVKTLRDTLQPNQKHLGHLLSAAGYQTGLVGKWHLKSVPTGFDYWNITKGQGRYHDPVMYEMDIGKPLVQKDQHSTDVFTDKAIRWMKERDQSRPFCLMLHFKATHEPWQFHRRYAGLFANVTFAEPENMMADTGPHKSRIPGWPLEILTRRMLARPDHGDGFLDLSGVDPKQTRRETYQKFVRDYLRCAVGIDDNIGRLLHYLDESGLSSNTLVIYTSDQGYFMGEHNYFDKRFMLEESLRMPFVARYPREIPPGVIEEDFILNVDFAPTLLDYAQVPLPNSMQGRSFRKQLRGERAEGWRDSMYYRYWENSKERPAHFGIRTKKAKLIFYDGLEVTEPGNQWELYDLKKDPDENTNIYDAKMQARMTRELKSGLKRWRRVLGDVD